MPIRISKTTKIGNLTVVNYKNALVNASLNEPRDNASSQLKADQLTEKEIKAREEKDKKCSCDSYEQEQRENRKIDRSTTRESKW